RCLGQVFLPEHFVAAAATDVVVNGSVQVGALPHEEQAFVVSSRRAETIEGPRLPHRDSARRVAAQASRSVATMIIDHQAQAVRPVSVEAAQVFEAAPAPLREALAPGPGIRADPEKLLARVLLGIRGKFALEVRPDEELPATVGGDR